MFSRPRSNALIAPRFPFMRPTSPTRSYRQLFLITESAWGAQLKTAEKSRGWDLANGLAESGVVGCVYCRFRAQLADPITCFKTLIRGWFSRLSGRGGGEQGWPLAGDGGVGRTDFPRLGSASSNAGAGWGVRPAPFARGALGKKKDKVILPGHCLVNYEPCGSMSAPASVALRKLWPATEFGSPELSFFLHSARSGAGFMDEGYLRGASRFFAPRRALRGTHGRHTTRAVREDHDFARIFSNTPI